MQTALEIALEQAERHGAGRISCIGLRIGPLSGVVPEALTLAFAAVTQGTAAEGARLALEETPLVCFCPACAEEFRPEGLLHACPRCLRPGGEVRGGRELEVAYLEVS